MTLNDTVLYLALSIPWGVAGWLAGFVTGYKAITWSRTMPTLIERPIETPSENVSNEPIEAPWYRRSQTWLGVAVAVIGLVTAVQWYFGGAETRRVAEETHRLAQCQAAYANGFADAIDARTKENAAVASGQDALWTLVDKGFTAPSPELRDEFQRQLRIYLDARAKAREAQIENPYPPAPRDLCK